MFHILPLLTSAWNLASIDRTIATTTIFLFHDLHEVTHVSHDFSLLFEPLCTNVELTFLAGIDNNKIRAIAVLQERHSQPNLLLGIASHPNHLKASSNIIDLMFTNSISLTFEKSLQPRVKCEFMYRNKFIK